MEAYNVTITPWNEADYGKLRLELALRLPDLKFAEVERRGPQAAAKTLTFLSKRILGVTKKELKDPLVRIQCRKALIEILMTAIGLVTTGGFVINIQIENRIPTYSHVSDTKTVTIVEDSEIIFEKDSCTVADLEKFKTE